LLGTTASEEFFHVSCFCQTATVYHWNIVYVIFARSVSADILEADAYKESQYIPVHFVAFCQFRTDLLPLAAYMV